MVLCLFHLIQESPEWSRSKKELQPTQDECQSVAVQVNNLFNLVEISVEANVQSLTVFCKGAQCQESQDSGASRRGIRMMVFT